MTKIDLYAMTEHTKLSIKSGCKQSNLNRFYISSEQVLLTNKQHKWKHWNLITQRNILLFPHF